MSIFDVLRYPISDPLTLEELEAVPDDIYLKWRNREFTIKFSSRRSVVIFLKSIKNIRFSGDSSCSDRVRSLKKMIRDMP